MQSLPTLLYISRLSNPHQYVTMPLKNVRKSIKSAYRKTRSSLFSPWARVTFSQECEDLLVHNQLRKRKRGFYVDIGGLHPIRFSNTYLFYLKGWRGIVVEPNPEAEALFRKHRPEDIFVGEGVAAASGNMEYHRFEEPALNTFDRELARTREETEGRPVKDRLQRRLSPLCDLLDRHLPQDTEIDLMSIDVEGLDDEVIRSNNWEKYRPRWLIAEVDLEHDNHGWIADLHDNATIRFLVSVGYQAVMKTGRSVIFKEVREQGH